MATIGSFKKVGDNEFRGEIATLASRSMAFASCPSPTVPTTKPPATASSWAGLIMRSEVLCGVSWPELSISVAFRAVVLRIIPRARGTPPRSGRGGAVRSGRPDELVLTIVPRPRARTSSATAGAVSG